MKSLAIATLLVATTAWTARAACRPTASFDQQAIYCEQLYEGINGWCPGDSFTCYLVLHSNSCFLQQIEWATFKTTSPDGIVDGPWVFAQQVPVRPGETVWLDYPVHLSGERTDPDPWTDDVKFAGWYQVPPAGQAWNETPWWEGTWSKLKGGYGITSYPPALCAEGSP
jgi:hypothetical protein